MKVSEAKEKVCPFMSCGFAADTTGLRLGGLVEITCRCGDCMAWVYVKTHERIENKASASDEKVCMSRYSDGAELSEDEKEGICMRLSR